MTSPFLSQSDRCDDNTAGTGCNLKAVTVLMIRCNNTEIGCTSQHEWSPSGPNDTSVPPGVAAYRARKHRAFNYQRILAMRTFVHCFNYIQRICLPEIAHQSCEHNMLLVRCYNSKCSPTVASVGQDIASAENWLRPLKQSTMLLLLQNARHL